MGAKWYRLTLECQASHGDPRWSPKTRDKVNGNTINKVVSFVKDQVAALEKGFGELVAALEKGSGLLGSVRPAFA